MTKVDIENQKIVFDCGCTIDVETFDYEGETFVSEGTSASICKAHTEQIGANVD